MKCGTPLSYCKAELPEGYPFKRCEPCRKYNRAMLKRHRIEQIKAGLCAYVRCNQPPNPGRSMCSKHLLFNLRYWHKRKPPKISDGSHPQQTAAL